MVSAGGLGLRTHRRTIPPNLEREVAFQRLPTNPSHPQQVQTEGDAVGL